MAKIVINGGNVLKGDLLVPGAKNAILPILAAAVLADRPVRILNCPKYADALNMLSILQRIGCGVEWEGESVIIDATTAGMWEMPETLAKELRSSIFMLGPILARFHKAKFSYPGGCEIGQRPIDLHLKGLRELNVSIDESHGNIYCEGESMRGADIHLDYPSVGATENIMMAAVKAKGTTIIRNAAREPEIVDLQNFLLALGARVSGAGSSSIEIEGVDRLGGAEYAAIPDRIAAGTWAAAAALTGGDLRLFNARSMHMHSVLAKLREAGCQIDVYEHYIRVRGPARPKEIHYVQTMPYPGFPTDMQAQLMAVASVSSGTSIIVENVFDNRFKHVPELCKMGADILVKDRTAIIRGVEKLTGTEVLARDLRGGAALTLAGLRAEGRTTVCNAEIINRGYEDIVKSLAGMGADIKYE